jgi:hypothetical protein
MEQPEQDQTPYEAPVVDDIDVAEGPSSVVPGGPITLPTS